MNLIKVVVLLAVYEGERNIEEQLLSILGQIGVEVDIFISIDPSTDKSLSICNEFSSIWPAVTILSGSERFGGAAPNFFRLFRDVDFSGYDYIALSDQDDIWKTTKLLRSVELLKLNSCDAYSSNVTAFWPDGRNVLVDKAQCQVQWDFLFESAGPGCTFVLDLNLALHIQNFIRENKKAMADVYLHDWFIYAFSRSNHYKWIIDKRPSMLYRQHAENQVGVNSGYKAFSYRVGFVLRGKALRQSLKIAKLCGLESHPFVKPWYNFSSIGLIKLALNSNKCRRKRSEKFLFFISCISFAFLRKKM